MKFLLSKNFLLKIIKNHKHHNPNSTIYSNMLTKHIDHINHILGSKNFDILNFANIFNFKFPFVSFGNVNTVNLLSDIIAFAFYYNKKNVYKTVLDVGSNVGLHSIIMSKLGFKVISFEPDPEHFLKLKRNIKLNNLKKIELYNKALSNVNSKKLFVRVLNNLTGNHILNSKKKPYGPTSIIKVHAVDAAKYLEKVDFAKIDCEGQEDKIFSCIGRAKKIPDILVEIHDSKKAKKIFNICKKNNIFLYSQKNSWNIVRKYNDMPFSHKDGLLFASKKKKLPFKN
jgi:FkbM family methyltransferase